VVERRAGMGHGGAQHLRLDPRASRVRHGHGIEASQKGIERLGLLRRCVRTARRQPVIGVGEAHEGRVDRVEPTVVVEEVVDQPIERFSHAWEA
jgi:hypothetical protein